MMFYFNLLRVCFIFEKKGLVLKFNVYILDKWNFSVMLK